jgi:pantoate--beta-alanine ligase
MGALHEGHLSLMRRARRENSIVVVSIFINPKQFGASEDLADYPRQKKQDVLLTKKENVDIIFYPSAETMYPKNFLTYVEVEKLNKHLCGRFRPGHFRGVATVVAKLLNIVQPDNIYLGQKDAQQAVILHQMIRDLNWPVNVKICPTIREKNGLALSSRNKYLTTNEHEEAAVIYNSLNMARQKVLDGEQSSKKICAAIKSWIQNGSSGRIQYVECVQADTLEPMKQLKGKILIALAVFFGKTRLIDNIIVHTK